MVDRFSQHHYPDSVNKKHGRASSTSVNVEELKRKLDMERKKDKTKNILVAAAAISAVAVSGFILSL